MKNYRNANKQNKPIVEFPISESDQERKRNAKRTGSKLDVKKTEQKKGDSQNKKGGKAINAINGKNNGRAKATAYARETDREISTITQSETPIQENRRPENAETEDEEQK